MALNDFVNNQKKVAADRMEPAKLRQEKSVRCKSH